MGFEGANVLFDTWVHPLMMGLEEHLLTMFRGDFEFHDGAAPSHLGSSKATRATPGDARMTVEPEAEISVAEPSAPSQEEPKAAAAPGASWAPDAERELHKIPFFVRGKARRNTERFALEKGVAMITIETLYDAKAHYGR
jgi:light-independent protochlorophyllide reductase subunit B